MPTRLAPASAGRIGEVAGLGQLDQLCPRGDVELPEDVAQVVVDRPRAEEELRGDLPVRRALAHEPGDLELLRSELVDRAGMALPCRLPARAELAASPLCPRSGAKAFERLGGSARVGAPFQPARGATERLAVEQLGPRALDRPVVACMQTQRRGEMVCSRLSCRELS